MVEIIIRSKLKKIVRDLNISAEVPEALDKEVDRILKKAEERARANGRRTLQGRDI